MSQVVTFEQVTPVARYDDVVWEQVRVEESDAADGTFTAIETIELADQGGLDTDAANPATRNLTTNEGTAPGLWYTLTFVDGDGNESAPTDPIQNITLDGAAYATVADLKRVVKPHGSFTAAETDAATRVLLMAAGEINSEIDRSDDDDALAGWQIALATEVNIERAAELWQETPFGIVGLGSDVGPTYTARNSWERHAQKLAPLKTQWGIA